MAAQDQPPAGVERWADQSDAKTAHPGAARVADESEGATFRTLQYGVALALLASYLLANIGLRVDWIRKIADAPEIGATVGRIGTLVAAVVVFYVAETSNRP